MRTKIALFFLACTIILADENEDFKYVYKLHESNMTNEVTDEGEKFLKDYQKSRYYDSVLNITAYNYFLQGKYNEALSKYEALYNSKFSEEALYYSVLIYIKKGDFENAILFSDKLENSKILLFKTYYEIAEAFYDKGEFAKAEEYYRLLIKENNEFYYDAFLKMALVYYNENDYLKAAAAAENYISEGKKVDRDKMATAYYIAAYSYDHSDIPSMAETYYEYLINNFNDSNYYKESLLNELRISYKNKKRDKVEKYAQMLNDTEYEADAYSFYIEMLFEAGDYEKAQVVADKYLTGVPNPRVLQKLALFYINKGDNVNIIKILEKLKESKLMDEYYYYSIVVNFKGGMYDKVKELLTGFEQETAKISKYLNDIYLIAGETYYKTKDYNKSSQYFEKLYYGPNIDTENRKKYLYRLILCYSELVSGERLKKYFDEYILKYPNDREYKKDIYIIAGTYYTVKKDYLNVEKVYKNYLENVYDRQISLNLIASLINQEKYLEADTYIKTVEETPENLYFLASTYLLAHNYGKAEESFRKIILMPSTSKYYEEAYLSLVESLFKIDKYDEVISFATEYENKVLKKYLEPIVLKKALSYFRLKRYDDAEKIFKILKESEKQREFATFMLGETTYNLKRFDSSTKYYEDIVDNYKKSDYRLDALYSLIKILYNRRDTDKCLSYIKLMLTDYPNSGEYGDNSIYLMANIYLDKNDLEKAIVEYEKLIKSAIKKDLKESILNKVITLYYKSEKYDEALKWSEKIESLGFRNIWKGKIFEKINREEDALKCYKDALIDKEYGDKGNYYLGYYYLKKKQYEKAREHFEKQKNYENNELKDDSLMAIALTYEEEGEYKKAIVTLMRVKFVYETSDLQDEVVYKIAENYDKLGDGKNSILYYMEFYNKYKGSDYYPLVVERMLVYYIGQNDMNNALVFYNELTKANKERAEAYSKYFSGGDSNK